MPLDGLSVIVHRWCVRVIATACERGSMMKVGEATRAKKRSEGGEENGMRRDVLVEEWVTNAV